MDIDPDVAALMDEGIPALHTPGEDAPPLWGRLAMEHSHSQAVTPATTFQPERVGNCRWCGVPLMKHWKMDDTWCDHNARITCRSRDLLVDPPEWALGQHWPDTVELPTKEESDFDAIMRLAAQLQPSPLTPLPPLPPRTTHCTAKRNRMLGHECRCRHDRDHFGFHECKVEDCRILWR